MNSDTFKKYNELFQRIRKYPKNKFQGEQLECISKLVFFGGVQRQQIPELRVRDVFDGKGRPLDKITKFKKEIILSDEMKRALEDYFNDLKSRPSSFTNRTSFLFPDYHYERKLRRHWKKFNTSHTQIKRDREIYKGEQERQRDEKRALESQDFDPENFEGDYITDIDYDR
jgi:predicted nucleotidyltransferase